MNFPRNLLQPKRAAWAIALATLFTILGGLQNVCAAPAAAAPGRYLLIVETSAAMRGRTEGTQKLLGDLLRSGFNGQLSPGDTVGVWTFNDQLHTGVFPLQLWTPQAREKIAAGLVGFLKAQRYEKAAKLDAVLPEMTGVVKESEKITVLLVTSGAEKINGTPYDPEINDTYQLNLAGQEKARLPYVTILRATKGEYAGYTVSTPPWPVEFPKFQPAPAPLKPAAPMASSASDAEKEQQRLAALRKTLEGGTIISLAATSQTILLSDGQLLTNKPAMESAEPVVTPPPAAAAALQNSVSESRPPEPPVPITNASAPVTAPMAPATQPPAAVFTVVAETNAPPPTQPKPAESAIAPAAPQPQPVEPVMVAPVAPTTPGDIPTPPPEEMPAARTLPRSVILVAGAVLVLAALSLLIVLLRRPTRRPPERVSLITRSLDKDPK